MLDKPLIWQLAQMETFFNFIMIIASLAFIGLGVHTIVSGWYLINNADFSPGRRPTRSEMMAHIPPPIRKLGVVSASIFFGCLIVLFVAELLFK